MVHKQIPLLSSNWYLGLFFSVGLTTFICAILAKLSKDLRQITVKFLGLVLLSEIVCTHLYLFAIQQTWSFADSLPLHLCRFSVILASVALLTNRQSYYEWAVYLGLPGGFHSILTPELTQGDSNWMLFDYYFTHSMLVITPIILTLYSPCKPRGNALITSFVKVNILALIVFPLNYIFHSNYMYLANKPIVNNPFLVGPWPWYILGLELVGIFHLVIIDIIFRVRPFGFLWRIWKSNQQNSEL